MQIPETLVPINTKPKRKSKINEKGQIATLDTSIAIITVLIIISISTIHSYRIINRSRKTEKKIEAYKHIYFATESLVTTLGTPKEWHETGEIERIGLAGYKDNAVQNHQLNSEKIHKLKEISLEEIKEKLVLEDREIELKIEDMNGEEVVKKSDIDSNEQTEKIQVERIALMEGEIH
ncbi:MAG: hypothetical protein ACOCTT_01660, partial [archaeon]